MKENVYRINYKNGNSLTTKALSMILDGGKLYQLCKYYPFDNPTPSILNGINIKSIELIERNNDI